MKNENDIILNDLLIKATHKKLQQKIKLLFINPAFQKDVNDTKKKFNTVIKRLSSAQKKLYSAITKIQKKHSDDSKVIFSKPNTSPDGKRLTMITRDWIRKHLNAMRTLVLNKQINKMLIGYGLPLKEREHFNTEIRTSALSEAIDKMLTKYDLSPKESWRGTLEQFIIYDRFIPPLSAINQTITFPTPTEERDFESNIVNSLIKQNFGMVIKKDEEEAKLFVQIYNNTSLEDIKRGWKLIDEVRQKMLGKKRFYPIKLKSIELAEKIIKMDMKNPSMSDSEKQEEIFGEVGDLNFGEIETRQKRKMKQMRSRYKKRFKLKS